MTWIKLSEKITIDIMWKMKNVCCTVTSDGIRAQIRSRGARLYAPSVKFFELQFEELVVTIIIKYELWVKIFDLVCSRWLEIINAGLCVAFNFLLIPNLFWSLILYIFDCPEESLIYLAIASYSIIIRKIE